MPVTHDGTGLVPRCLSLAVAAVLAAAPASAQERLEEIIVTAQKREQNLQDIGISITALSGDEIRNLGLTTTRADCVSALMMDDFPTLGLPTIASLSGSGPSVFSAVSSATTSWGRNAIAAAINGSMPCP